jgi:hypothetical protein
LNDDAHGCSNRRSRTPNGFAAVEKTTGSQPVIEIQFVFEGGQEDLHHSVVPAAALGRHAATGLVALKKLPVGRSPVLASLIRMDQELIGLNLPVTQRLVQGLLHQRGFHAGAHGPADHTAAVQIDEGCAQRTSRCDTARYRQPAVVRM